MSNKKGKNKGGRPAKFSTPEELEQAIDEYIEKCQPDENGKGIPMTMTGLALHLGFCDRQSLYDYQKKPEFSCLIKKALLHVENSYEMRACDSNKPTGPIFVLKNMGWSDKQEIVQDVHVTGEPNITFSNTTKKDTD